MPYTSKIIANYFLDLAREARTSLTPMKIQKLVYYAHGLNLALNDCPLIVDPVEAWKYGPVIPTLYHSFKQYGAGPITEKALSWISDGTSVVAHEPKVPIDDYLTKTIMDAVWDNYGGLTGIQLSNMTHEPGSPWDQVWKTVRDKNSADISDEIIKRYFCNLLNA